MDKTAMFYRLRHDTRIDAPYRGRLLAKAAKKFVEEVAEKSQDVRSTVEKASRNQNLAIVLTTLAPLVNDADAERISQTRHKLITDQDHEARKEAVTLTKELTGRYSPLGEYIGPTLRNTLNPHSPSPTQLSPRQEGMRVAGELKRKLEEEQLASAQKDQLLLEKDRIIAKLQAQLKEKKHK